MAYTLSVTISELQKKFITEKELSPSALIQEKINKLMKEKDPELYQSNLQRFGEKFPLTKWQTRLNAAKNYEERNAINLEMLKTIGIDTSTWN